MHWALMCVTSIHNIVLIIPLVVVVRYGVCLNEPVKEALPHYPNLLDRDDLTVMVYGSGGREHALAWKLSQSERIGRLIVGPGNGGTDQWNAPGVVDVKTGLRCAVEQHVDVVVVGPDQALADGMVDQLAVHGIAAFGPTRQAAKIEWWKPYGKRLMHEAGIPTADFRVFCKAERAHHHIDNRSLPVVLKTPGLAAGKGVLVTDNLADAHAFIDNVMKHSMFGNVSGEIVIEDPAYNDDGTAATEFSMHAVVGKNGYTRTVLPFVSSQDYKQANDGDHGANSGGMGTIAPVSWLPQGKINELAKIYVDPMVELLAKNDIEYRGIIYPGIMGGKKLEDNARYGDPEAQVYMRLLESDLGAVTVDALTNRLGDTPLEWQDGHAICVVAAARGYPGLYKKGQQIGGLVAAESIEGVKVFHAGTIKQDGDFYTNGGRVLNITATGRTPQEANERAYSAIQHVTFDGSPGNVHFRTDIGKRPDPVNF